MFGGSPAGKVHKPMIYTKILTKTPGLKLKCFHINMPAAPSDGHHGVLLHLLAKLGRREHRILVQRDGVRIIG